MPGLRKKADGASQGYVLCNLSKKGNVATWTFDVAEAGTYDLTMALASTNLIGKDVALSKRINMQVNGVDTDVSEIEILGSGVLKYNQFATMAHCRWMQKAGTNTITWTVIGYSVPNVDYVELYKVTE